ncbi:hypothetical protein ACFX2H_012789 [Malus domestica]
MKEYWTSLASLLCVLALCQSLLQAVFLPELRYAFAKLFNKIFHRFSSYYYFDTRRSMASTPTSSITPCSSTSAPRSPSLAPASASRAPSTRAPSPSASPTMTAWWTTSTALLSSRSTLSRSGRTIPSPSGSCRMSRL